MGHNFGLYHSHSNTCDTTGCTQAEYGDDHDVMGNYTTAHFNAYQKERLGWLNSGTSPPIQTVTTVGPYTLEAYETPWGGLPKALEIFQSASAGENTYLYAEVRTPYGIDSTIAPGVLIHAGNDTDGNQSFLQDVLPTTTATDFILDPGQSVTFAGDTSPITFTTLSADATGAVVAVTPSPAPCTYSLGAMGQSMVSGGERNEQCQLDHSRRREHERRRTGEHLVHRCRQCVVVAPHWHGDHHRPDLHGDAGRDGLQLYGDSDFRGVQLRRW
jgi:hypothetical protein